MREFGCQPKPVGVKTSRFPVFVSRGIFNRRKQLLPVTPSTGIGMLETIGILIRDVELCTTTKVLDFYVHWLRRFGRARNGSARYLSATLRSAASQSHICQRQANTSLGRCFRIDIAEHRPCDSHAYLQAVGR